MPRFIKNFKNHCNHSMSGRAAAIGEKGNDCIPPQAGTF